MQNYSLGLNFMIKIIFITYKKGEFVMELYLLAALILVYFVTVLMLDKHTVRRIWTLAFIGAYILTAVAIVFVRIYHQTVLLGANPLNWYYLLYLFGSIAVVLGVVNLWIYRKALWQIIWAKSAENQNKE
jgi:hypothetical protein